MNLHRVAFRLTTAWGPAVLLFGASCASQPREEPIEPPEERPMEEPEYADERDEARAAMYERHMQQAVRYRNAGQLENALQEVNQALAMEPASEDALRLRSEIERLMGLRSGQAGTVMDDVREQQTARLEQQKVTVRRLLDEADRAMRARNWDAARRSYEDALFIVDTSRYAPLEGDTELSRLGQQARQGLDRLERIETEAAAERERRATEAALREIAAQEERALVEARERRARLLTAAIDAFNQEDFERAEEYANQVLAEEPDNTVAQEIQENARRAQHVFLNERYLRELKNSYRRWRVAIESAKVPSSEILEWPSQTYWDQISRLRAARAIGTDVAERTPEEERVANILRTRTVDLPFEGVPFLQVRDYLTAASGVNFVIDPRSRDDLEVAEVNLQAQDVTVQDALVLIMQQVSPEREIVYEITGNVVRFIHRENVRRRMVLQIHPVADLTLGLTDFIPPQITQLGVGDDFETPLFGGQAEEAPQPYGTIDELMELVRSSVAPQSWDEGNATITPQGKNLVVYNTPAVQQQVVRFLDDLRAFSGIVITIETRFLSVTNAFLRDVGVDFRGLGGTNGGPLAILDDVTSGLDDNASAGRDNSGPGVEQGGAAAQPSSGLFFNDGADGDFRGRSENMFINPLGELLSSLGGGTFQITYLDDLAISAIIRLVEKSADIRELTAPRLTVFNTQRANLTVVNQISFVQDFDVEVAQTSFIADPVIGVIQDGLTLDVRPTVSNDRQYITLELRPTVVDLVTPIATFQTLLGASIAFFSAQNPVTIQLPEVDQRLAESTARIPDGGSLLLGGLKDIRIEDKKSTTPILGDIPILSFLFSRQGKSEEVEHLMIVVTSTITDLQEQSSRLRGVRG